MQSAKVRNIVGPTILLRSGNYFDFLDPENSIFEVEDIAHGLSMICRFTGHCNRFYSVAEHSVIASHNVDLEHAYDVLMHDAAEAFLGDISSPLKSILPDFKELEHSVETAIFQKLGVRTPLSSHVKHIDLLMLATEQKLLMNNRDEWKVVGGRKPLDIYLPCWSPDEAKKQFMKRYGELTTCF